MPAIPQVLTLLVTIGAAAAPSLAPILAALPAWAHSLIAGGVAGFGALYHLYQPVPAKVQG